MKNLLIVVLAAGICHAQSYPTYKPRPKRSPSPSVYLPKGTVYTDKNGQDQLVTGPGQTRNVTDAAPAEARGSLTYANSPPRPSGPGWARAFGPTRPAPACCVAGPGCGGPGLFSW